MTMSTRSSVLRTEALEGRREMRMDYNNITKQTGNAPHNRREHRGEMMGLVDTSEYINSFSYIN